MMCQACITGMHSCMSIDHVIHEISLNLFTQKQPNCKKGYSPVQNSQYEKICEIQEAAKNV